jgi:hypothetical protein
MTVPHYGRAAHSRGRTSTGKSHGIHGILSGTFFKLLQRDFLQAEDFRVPSSEKRTARGMA